VNGIFIAGILGLIALLVRAGFAAENPNDSVAWGFGFLFVYAMMAAGLLLVILLVHSVVARTLLYLKWPFVLFTLTYLVLTSSRDLVLPRLTGSDTVRLRVENRTGVTIDKLAIFGRGAHLGFDRLRADSAKVAAFRGRKLNFQAGDPYSNRVWATWYAGGQWRERLIVGQSRVIGDSMIIQFPTLDSVTVAVW